MVEADEIRRVYYAEPFRPFALRLKDGRLIKVLEPLRLALLPDGKTVDVAYPAGGGDRFPLEMVDAIEELTGDHRKAS